MQTSADDEEAVRFFVSKPMGSMLVEHELDVLDSLLDELGDAPAGYRSVSVTHPPTQSALTVYSRGRVAWEHLDAVGDEQKPLHQSGLDRDAILRLMKLVATGDFAQLDHEPWLDGYPR